MSEAIRQLQRDWERARRAEEAGLSRELRRQLVDPVRLAFVASFRLQQRYQAEPAALPLDQYAIAEGADLAADPGWDANRAWLHSESRKDAIEAVEKRRSELSSRPLDSSPAAVEQPSQPPRGSR